MLDKFIQGKYTRVNLLRARLPLVKLPRVRLPSLRAVKLGISWDEWDYCFHLSFLEVQDEILHEETFTKKTPDIFCIQIHNLNISDIFYKIKNLKK